MDNNKKSLTNINASLYTNPLYGSTYAQYNKNLLQTEINTEWQYATDLFSIEEELVKGSNIFSQTEVRINHILSDKNTGEKLGDDWRSIIFKNVDHVYGMGHKYRFNDNYWLTIQSDFYKFVTASAGIRRCNNILRWIDEDGNKIQEPCIINYNLKNTRNQDNPNIITPRGDIEVIVQYNDRTKLIYENQRFLFGDPRKAYKIRGGGINNFLNQITFDDSTTPLIYIYMDSTQINTETDDLINGYANINLINYSVQINEDSFSQAIGYSDTLTCTKTLNGLPNNFNVIWSSSDESLATIDNLGNFILLDIGDVIFYCTMEDNNLINDNIQIHIDSVIVGNTQIVIDNQIFELKQETSESYSVFLYVDGIKQLDPFIVTASGVPVVCYTLEIIDSNNFKITNNQMSNCIPLKINVTSGINSRDIYIDLKGIW